MALALVAKFVGEDVAKAIQLGIEYDPEPPFDSGLAGQGGAGAGRADRETRGS